MGGAHAESAVMALTTWKTVSAIYTESFFRWGRGAFSSRIMVSIIS